MFHKLTALGRISKPEARQNASGNLFLRFGLAVNKKVKGEEVTHWHNCILSGRLAEVMEPMLESGMTLLVEGEPSVRKAEDGREFHNVFVSTLRIASNGNGNGNANSQQPAADGWDDAPF